MSTIKFPGDYEESGGEATRVFGVAEINVCPLTGPNTGQTFRSEGNPIVIGRSPSCTIVLDNEGVSRVHARIDYREGVYWLESQNTLNGTRVNGQLIRGAHALQDGDTIHICDQALMVFYGAPDQAALHQAIAQPIAHEGSRPYPMPGPPQQRRAPTASPESMALVADVVGPSSPSAPRAWFWIAGGLGLLGLLAGAVAITLELSRSNEPAPAPAPAPAHQPPTAIAAVEPIVIEVVSPGNGTVSRVARAQTELRAGDEILRFREHSKESSELHAKLRKLEKKFGSSPEHADFIAAARAEYAAARARRRVVSIEAPADGTLEVVLLRDGDRVREGDPVARVMTGARIVGDPAAFQGSGERCTAVVVSTGDQLTGRRDGDAIVLDRAPERAHIGAIGEVRITCTP